MVLYNFKPRMIDEALRLTSFKYNPVNFHQQHYRRALRYHRVAGILGYNMQGAPWHVHKEFILQLFLQHPEGRIVIGTCDYQSMGEFLVSHELNTDAGGPWANMVTLDDEHTYRT